jgi:hypothetical protein
MLSVKSSTQHPKVELVRWISLLRWKMFNKRSNHVTWLTRANRVAERQKGKSEHGTRATFATRGDRSSHPSNVQRQRERCVS